MNAPAAPMKLAVIISTWTGSPSSCLDRLLASMRRRPAGTAYDLCLCANGRDYALPADLAGAFSKVLVRENTGYNIAAWDHAWRSLSGYTHFLFLQDDCVVKKKNWLLDFVGCFQSHAGCGLVGEHYNKAWDLAWSDLTACQGDAAAGKVVSEEQRARALFYLNTLKEWGIDPGSRARHITTVVQFTSAAVLRSVNGYPIADAYEEAIAAEIGFSRKIEAKGYHLQQVGKRRHSRIAHHQWPADGFFPRFVQSLKKRHLLK